MAPNQHHVKLDYVQAIMWQAGCVVMSSEKGKLFKTVYILSELHGATIFSNIGLKRGYDEIMLDEAGRNITAFATQWDLLL